MKHIRLDRELCTGCGVCAEVCPVKAIELSYDAEGYLYPRVNEETCIECGKCLHYCHLQQKKESDDRQPVRRRYAVKHKDEAVRAGSRSGGVFVALSDHILRENGAVYGAAFEDVKTVKHIRAVTAEQRNLMCGSKYVQSDTRDVYTEIEQDLKQGRKVLYTGTPCQVAAVYSRFRAYAGKNLYLCDFICHGVPSPLFFRQYLEWVEKKYADRVLSFDFRDKTDHSWRSHVEKLVFPGKVIYSRRYANLFCCNCCLRETCYQCPYTTERRVSDFTIGDYWGLDKIFPQFDDGKGVSYLGIRSDKGMEVFEAIRGSINYQDTTEFTPTHYNLSRPTKRPENRDSFWKDYHDKGFAYVSAKYGEYDILRRIRNKIKFHID